MKRLIFVLGLFLFSVSNLFAQETIQHNRSYGVLFMAGMRHDDVRMCVATDAGVKGGPMADVQLVIRWNLSDDKTLAFNLPVMRPILFLAAFNMFQFEQEVNLEIYKKLESGTTIVSGPGFGISFHSGPGYESDLENPGESFVAFGPVFNWKWAIVLNPDRNSLKTIGAKVFYPPSLLRITPMVRLSVPHSNTKWGFKIVATKAIPKVMLEMKENSCDSAKM